MFDYAMFVRLLEERVNDNSEAILYVCDTRYCTEKVKKSLKKQGLDYNDKSKYIILTIREIWDYDALRGQSYKEYKFIH